MIKKETIEAFAINALTDEYFIVNISVKKDNNIEVVIDGQNGVSIQKCVDVSRAIESNLDREVEDYELSVFSAGLGKPFKVYRQYLKNIGKEVEVSPSEGKPVSGILASVDNNGFELEITTTQKAEGSKKKVEVTNKTRFNFDTKPKVKNIITFK
jgi:ribosome maturation factor RimP